MPPTSALILFAHGSRDPEWVRPFEQLRQTIQRATPQSSIVLAYLESAAPDLTTAIRALAGAGTTSIRVLPLFLAMGKHLRNDVPALARRLTSEFPGVDIEFLPSLGEAPEFIDALTRIALRSMRQGS